MKYNMLVVEDDPRNLRAAREYFAERKEILVRYATTLQEARYLLESEITHTAIADLNFPRIQGNEPEFIGLELGQNLSKIGIPFIYYSAGVVNHHGQRDVGNVYLDDWSVTHNQPIKIAPKYTIEGWQKAHNLIVNPENLEAMVNAINRRNRIRRVIISGDRR